MPTSYHEVASHLVEEVLRWRPKSILDLGVGFGKYGVLLREALDVAELRYDRDTWQTTLVGVEGHAAYRNPIHDYVYDEVHYGRIQDLLGSLEVFDVVLLIDVLEHFTKDEGHRLLAEMLAHTRKALVVSTPADPAPQTEYLGNTLEAHLSRWGERDFARLRGTTRVIPVGRNGAVVAVLFPEGAPSTPLTDSVRERLRAADGVWADDAPTVAGSLNLAYWLPHHHVTGGLKMALAHVAALRSRGHRVTVAYRGPGTTGALPSWSTVGADGELALPLGDVRAAFAPFDAVIATYFRELTALPGIPTLYMEQGHEVLFGDVPDTPYGRGLLEAFDLAMTLPVAVAAVSPHVADQLRDRYGRRCGLVPNGIDTDAFHPEPRTPGHRVLLVGNPTLPFKGFDVALRALREVHRQVPTLTVTWVCQTRPEIPPQPFPLDFVVDPEQGDLPAIYRGHDALLFASRYEAFGLPPLEAMASGVPVVTTRCGGVETYAEAGENCLMAAPGQWDRLATALSLVLRDEGAQQQLAAAGRATAVMFGLDRMADSLDDAVRRVVAGGGRQW